MGIKERIRELFEKQDRESLEERRLELQESESKNKMLKERRGLVESEANQKEKDLLKFAKGTPLPSLLEEARQTLQGYLEEESDVSVEHTSNNHWSEDDKPQVVGEEIVYTLSWRHGIPIDKENLQYSENHFTFFVRLNVNGSITFGKHPDVRDRKSRKTIKKWQWENNPKLLEDTILQYVENPHHHYVEENEDLDDDRGGVGLFD